MMDFWTGRVDQKIIGPDTAALLGKTKRQLLLEVLMVCGQYNSKDGVHSMNPKMLYIVKKEHLQNLMQMNGLSCMNL